MTEEIPLKGGSVNSPVKVGSTVRRVAGPWTPTLHALMNYLADQGFRYVARPLGFDERGREILQFLPGVTALRPWPTALRTDEGVHQAAQMLREYHDIVAGFDPGPSALWRMGRVPWSPGQIIRHGDLGPWNTLWVDGRLTGLIDWDFAEPGERVTDLAQLAWYFLPLRGEANVRESGFTRPPELWHRLEVLTETYGGNFTPDEVLDELDRLQHLDMQRTEELGGAGIYPWSLFWDRGGMKTLIDENTWLRAWRKSRSVV